MVRLRNPLVTKRQLRLGSVLRPGCTTILEVPLVLGSRQHHPSAVRRLAEESDPTKRQMVVHCPPFIRGTGGQFVQVSPCLSLPQTPAERLGPSTSSENVPTSHRSLVGNPLPTSKSNTLSRLESPTSTLH